MQSGKYLTLEQGQAVFEVGSTCSTFYVVLSGCIGLHGGDSLPQMHSGRRGRRHAALTPHDATTPDANCPEALVDPDADGVLEAASAHHAAPSWKKSSFGTRRSRADASGEASRSRVTFVRRGERFGDADLLMSALKRTTSAFAHEPTELLELPRASYYQCAAHLACVSWLMVRERVHGRSSAVFRQVWRHALQAGARAVGGAVCAHRIPDGAAHSRALAAACAHPPRHVLPHALAALWRRAGVRHGARGCAAGRLHCSSEGAVRRRRGWQDAAGARCARGRSAERQACAWGRGGAASALLSDCHCARIGLATPLPHCHTCVWYL